MFFFLSSASLLQIFKRQDPEKTFVLVPIVFYFQVKKVHYVKSEHQASVNV